jgi:hypothetical protein
LAHNSANRSLHLIVAAQPARSRAQRLIPHRPGRAAAGRWPGSRPPEGGLGTAAGQMFKGMRFRSGCRRKRDAVSIHEALERGLWPIGGRIGLLRGACTLEVRDLRTTSDSGMRLCRQLCVQLSAL